MMAESKSVAGAMWLAVIFDNLMGHIAFTLPHPMGEETARVFWTALNPLRCLERFFFKG